MYTIRLIEKENLSIILPLLKVLNKSIDDITLKERLEEMRCRDYNCVGVFKGDELIAICGFWILVKYYVGKHIEPDNVIV